MRSGDEAIAIDDLERRLLHGAAPNSDGEAEDEGAGVYDASFEEMEDKYLNYQTARWVLYSLLLVLAWGIGLVMLLYLPIRRHVLRKDFQSRRLFVSPNSIVYKMTRPAIFPCFGVLKKEKHILLPSVADVVVEQGYLQSFFGIYSIRIENAGVRRPAGDDVQIQGLANPRAFRKAVLTCLSSMRRGTFGEQSSVTEDSVNYNPSHPLGVSMTPKQLRDDGLPSDELILHRIEEVGSSVRRVQALIERQSRSLKTCPAQTESI